MARVASTLSDINFDLICLYQVIRNDAGPLVQKFEYHHRRHCKAYYYAVRQSLPRCAVNRAARTLYLNRTCWNGLYRVNLKGQFNVPMDTKIKVFDPSEDFFKLSAILSAADLRCRDFEETISDARSGDFLFVDPPYTVQHNQNGFVNYNETIFSWSDQERLSKSLKLAARRGVAIVLNNADHQSIHELYGSEFKYAQLFRSSVLASETIRRGEVSEPVFVANV